VHYGRLGGNVPQRFLGKYLGRREETQSPGPYIVSSSVFVCPIKIQEQRVG
jgi:hypothetical protein